MRAVVTGASAGSGRDIARQLASRGAELVLVARREDRLTELAAELPVRVEVYPCDLADPDACVELHRRVSERPVDILVNNAGFGVFGAFDETDLQKELALIDVNIRAVHILTKLFYRDFAARGSGRILNVASSAGFMPGPLLSSYYASKAYVLRLTEALHEELRRMGSPVTVSAFCPGPVSTEFDAVADVRFSVRGISSERAAKAAVEGMFRGKLVIVPGLQMKAAHVGSRLLPDRLMLRLTWHMQRRKMRDSSVGKEIP